MANLQAIRTVAKRALETFTFVKGDRNVFLDKLDGLCLSMNRLRAVDLCVDPAEKSVAPLLLATAPVGYMFIAENSTVSMGIFLVERGCKLPLHDHMGMYGVIKVLSGKIRMQSYDVLTEEQRKTMKLPDLGVDGVFFPKGEIDGDAGIKLTPVLKRPELELTPESKPCVLSPMEANIHSIESVGGPATFLDILSPPYDPDVGRDCMYYKETIMTDSNTSIRDVRWLQRIPQPSSFWCRQEPYLGPAVDLDQL